jgi:hypothetical protein
MKVERSDKMNELLRMDILRKGIHKARGNAMVMRRVEFSDGFAVYRVQENRSGWVDLVYTGSRKLAEMCWDKNAKKESEK